MSHPGKGAAALAVAVVWLSAAACNGGPAEAALAGAARADLEALARSSTDATATFQGGEIARAVTLAQHVKAKADALAARIGPVPAPEVRP